MITVQLLGGACLRSGGAPLLGPPVQRHRIALLTLIVDAWPQPLPRDRAIALLWPERDQKSGRRLLNLAVHVLRGALGDAALASVGDGLLLNPEQLTCDLHELRAAITGNDPDGVVRLAGGSLLDGFHLPESAEFSHWLDQRRNELARACTDALLAVADRQERAGDARALVGTCLRLVDTDVYSPAHALRLMRALDAAGERRAALDHAATYARRVREDLGIAPDPQVDALAAELRAAPARSAPVDSAVPSVAVLPFLNVGGDPEHEYFADGITEDVIAQLSKIRALKVISRGSVMAFKSRTGTLKQIGSALGTRTVLDGTVRHAGDRVRIVATLVDVDAGRQLWAETYDRQLTDIFAIQTDVALRIAAALRAELSSDERGRLGGEATRDVLAYQLFLQGRQWHIGHTVAGYSRATEFYERAVSRDPAFALAFAHLSLALTELVESGFVPAADAGPRSELAAATALRLAPDLGEAHCAMGFVRGVVARDAIGAERHFTRAIQLSPGGADILATYGRLLAGWGRHDEAIAMLERSRELDPLVHRCDIATALLRAGRCDEAILRAEAAAELDLGRDRALATLGWAYFLSGRKEEGLAQLERAVALNPQNPSWLAQLGEAQGLAGNTRRAREILRQLEEMARTTFVSPYHVAYVHTGLGEVDEALDLLERAAATGAGPLYSLGSSFLLAPLRDHPRFQALLT